MDSRLVLTVVLVTFVWMFVGTNAQSPTTTRAATTRAATTRAATTRAATTRATITTRNPTNTQPATNAQATTTNTPNTQTTTNAQATTTNTPNTQTTTKANTANTQTTTNAQTTTTNIPNTQTTTNAPTTTRSPAISTTAVPTTAVINNTAAPVLVSNFNVTPLQINISREGCGSSQLCVDDPDNCDPSVEVSCTFVSLRQISGQNFFIQLSGQADGYVAASLSTDTTAGGNDPTYICSRNNTEVRFAGAFLNNGILTPQPLNANSVKGRINGNTIQCTFDVTLPDATARAAATSFSMGFATGTVGPSGALGSPTFQLRTPVIDVSNPNSTTTNVLTTTVAPTTTTNHAVTLQQSLSRALLVIVGMLGLAML